MAELDARQFSQAAMLATQCIRCQHSPHDSCALHAVRVQVMDLLTGQLLTWT